ncbi:MAG: pectin esterase [Ardenticatenales bacterium]|nr:pectin esterase [Ardenticatenales bacterium]
MKHLASETMKRPGPAWGWFGRFAILAVLAGFFLFFARTNAQTTNITLEVREYVAGAPAGSGPIIADFDYLINLDNTGDPDDPDPNNHPSLKPMASHSPVVGLGSQTAPGEADFNLADGRYLISVRADGYKLGGIHVSVPDQNGTVLVELVSDPLPLATIRVHVFQDFYPVNGQDDTPRELGLPNFRAFLHDTVGEMSVDWYGNPLCSEYDGVGGSTPLGDPIPGTGGVCYSDANGDVVIPNIPRGKYAVLVLPPEGEDNDWIQTSTIEGKHEIDAWVVEGNDGYSTEGEGFGVPLLSFGFTQPCNFGNASDVCDTNDVAGTGTIQGTIMTLREWIPQTGPVPFGDPVFKPYIALTDIGNNDLQVYLGRGEADGSFVINDVPAGTYQMAIWDEPLDYIFSFETVIIGDGEAVDLGELGIPRWFSQISGYVFMDDGLDVNRNADPALIAGNGIRDCVNPADEESCERPIDGIPLGTRYRDGTLQHGAVTNNDGYYEFTEVQLFPRFVVIEVDFTRMGVTGASLHSIFDGSVTDTFDGALTLAELTWPGIRSEIDWGKVNYGPGENGGISGIVYYATTRNENDLRKSAAEDYEPGVPNVTVQLWNLDHTVLLNEVTTDAWEHPTGCDYTDPFGVPLPDPIGYGPNCLEVPNISNEVKAGVFDGGYAIETMFPDGYPNGSEVTLVPGDYVVELVAPPYFRAITLADINTSDGNEYQPAGPIILQPPSPCGNGECSQRIVTLQQGHNAPADFFLMTDNAVPIPGRIFGLLLDDINVETDPARLFYGEKRGVPNTPVGIRDFTGRLITTVHTDDNGVFEVLLPSTYAANCPTPSGVCPAMYRIIGNDPGDPLSPNADFNPNYQTIEVQLDVWPGKMTVADVAIFPITAFVNGGGQFNQPVDCSLPAGFPEIWNVSVPYGSTGDIISIYGTGFGTTAGQVLVNGAPYPANRVTWVGDGEVQIDLRGSNGQKQVLIRNSAGETSVSGITLHKIGGSYNPNVVHVTPDPLGTPIQDAIDATDAATSGQFYLIVVEPGTYFESPLLDKPGVRLQGYGPGQLDGFGTGGTVIDERFTQGTGLTVTADAPGTFVPDFYPLVDGFRITGARDQANMGGGIVVGTYAERLVISNNIIQSNSGFIGGGIVMGQPYVGDNGNDVVRIHHNRILNNGGVTLAGGVAIYNGAEQYEIDHNDICGNFSAEYGGGISHFGLSTDSQIHHNRIYYNNAFDEGGGLMVAGEQFITLANPEPEIPLTVGSGVLTIYNNLFQGNLSNDDGGAIRFLQPWDYELILANNIVVNNVSTDMGGGVSADDASDLIMINNTIANNANTSTAEDSDGLAHGAGLAVEHYSAGFTDYLIATYGSAGAGWVDPVMANNIFWNNQAYTWDGLALTLDSVIDLEVFTGGTFSWGSDPTNLVGVDPLFVDPFTTALDATAFTAQPDLVTVVIITVTPPGELAGDYHILAGSPAVNMGYTLPDLRFDYDDQFRPQGPFYDIGADELLFAPPAGPTMGTPATLCDGNATAAPPGCAGPMFFFQIRGLLAHNLDQSVEELRR